MTKTEYMESKFSLVKKQEWDWKTWWSRDTKEQ